MGFPLTVSQAFCRCLCRVRRVPFSGCPPSFGGVEKLSMGNLPPKMVMKLGGGGGKAETDDEVSSP